MVHRGKPPEEEHPMRQVLARTDEEPAEAELRSIEREWPLIEAEMALVVAEIHVLTTNRPSELDWRRLRRAEARVAREAIAWAARSGAGVALVGAA
jgi:hypothetical protein